MSSLNAQIKVAIDSFDTTQARALLRDAMKEADAETYYLASRVALDDDQKHEFLEKAIALDPFHEKARAALKSVKRAANGAPPVVEQDVPVASATPPTSTNTASAVDAPTSTPKNESVFTASLVETPSVRATPRVSEPVATSPTTQTQESDVTYPVAVIRSNLISMERIGIPASIVDKVKSNEPDLSSPHFALTHDPVELRTLPHADSVPLAKLSDGTQVIPFQRTQDMDWVRVIYQSALGSKEGWVPSGSLHEISINGNAIPLIELPVLDYADSQFGLTRQQVQEILGNRTKYLKTFNDPINSTKATYDTAGCGTVIFGLMGVLSIAIGILGGAFNGGRSDALGTLVGSTFIGVASLWLARTAISNRKKLLSANTEAAKFLPVANFFIEQVKTLDLIQKNLRSDYEVMRDEQRRDAAIGFAANLGATLLNTAASRYIPNRQKVTIERK